MINILLSVRLPFSGLILDGKNRGNCVKMHPASPAGNTSLSGSTSPGKTENGPSSASVV